MKERNYAELAQINEIATTMLAELSGFVSPEDAAERLGLELEDWETTKDYNNLMLKDFIASPRKWCCDLCDEGIDEMGGYGVIIPDDPDQCLSFGHASRGIKHLCIRCIASISALQEAKARTKSDPLVTPNAD